VVVLGGGGGCYSLMYGVAFHRVMAVQTWQERKDWPAGKSKSCSQKSGLSLQDIVSKSKSGLLTAIALFGTPLAGVIIDEIENRVSFYCVRKSWSNLILQADSEICTSTAQALMGV